METRHFFIKSMKFKGLGPILTAVGTGRTPMYSKRVARDRETKIRTQFLFFLAYGIEKQIDCYRDRDRNSSVDPGHDLLLPAGQQITDSGDRCQLPGTGPRNVH